MEGEEGEVMAFGSLAGLWKYVHKTFDVVGLLGELTDGRREPVVPLQALMLTWLFAFMRRLASTEQAGDLLNDPRWRKLIGLADDDGGSPDTLARALDMLTAGELHDLLLRVFFEARRAGILKDDGPFGKRCAIVDMNELFASEKVHCKQCQVRLKQKAGPDGTVTEVKEYFHQAVALVWAGEDVGWPIGWELLEPGEGEWTAAQRLLRRLLPKLGRSLDLVIGDGLYCCRDFFSLVSEAGIAAMAISSGQTEMDAEMELLVATEPPKRVLGQDVDLWELESEAWEKDVGRKLRVLHYRRTYPAPSWKHERRELRLVTSCPVVVLPVGQGWSVGRCRWRIENGTFNLQSRFLGLTHNYHHHPVAIVGLLVLRSIAQCLVWAYHRFATARSKDAPKTLLAWFEKVLVEDWVRFLDRALVAANPLTG